MQAETHQNAASKSHGPYLFALVLGFLMLLFGFLMTVGFLGSTNTVSKDMSDMYMGLAVLIFFFLFPCMLISRCLDVLKAYYRLPGFGIAGITLFGVLMFAGGETIKIYNHYVTSDENITQAFTDIELAYQKRFNVIKNLDTASRRYETHERAVIKDIVGARQGVLGATTEGEKIKTMGKFDASVRTLALNMEQYPHLKADGVIQTLMKEIVATEKELLELKKDYNKKVVDYNKSVRIAPFSLFTRLFHFQTKRFINKEAGQDIYDSQKLLTR